MGIQSTKSSKLLDQSFWESKWQTNETGWDIGYAAPPVTEYMTRYPDKNAAVLIPGCGNAYEAEFLVEKGFTNITLIDIAPQAVASLKKKFSGQSQVNIICGDFFRHQGQYDLIIEQTFFCAIPPQRRKEYAAKTASLLRNKGKIMGVLFDIAFNKQGPPFGGSHTEYQSVFGPFFTIHKMETCRNSIPPRSGTEVFIVLIKKHTDKNTGVLEWNDRKHTSLFNDSIGEPTGNPFRPTKQKK